MDRQDELEAERAELEARTESLRVEGQGMSVPGRTAPGGAVPLARHDIEDRVRFAIRLMQALLGEFDGSGK